MRILQIGFNICVQQRALSCTVIGGAGDKNYMFNLSDKYILYINQLCTSLIPNNLSDSRWLAKKRKIYAMLSVMFKIVMCKCMLDKEVEKKDSSEMIRKVSETLVLHRMWMWNGEDLKG